MTADPWLAPHPDDRGGSPFGWDDGPQASCRHMETRTCPESYNGPCGDRPCARFETNATSPREDHQ